MGREGERLVGLAGNVEFVAVLRLVAHHTLRPKYENAVCEATGNHQSICWVYILAQFLASSHYAMYRDEIVFTVAWQFPVPDASLQPQSGHSAEEKPEGKCSQSYTKHLIPQIPFDQSHRQGVVKAF